MVSCQPRSLKWDRPFSRISNVKLDQSEFRWPAEWEPHAATWIAWPHNQDTWPQRFDGIPECFAAIIRTLARYEPVHVLAGGEAVMAQAASMVGDLANVTLHDIATNDVWIRDYGPTFLQGPGPGNLTAIDWLFNSWGQKYSPWDLDSAATERITQWLGVARVSPGMVMEGGGLEGNGHGTILTTRSCLLDPSRNPRLSQQDIERQLCRYLGADRVLWIGGGPMAGDDTDGHIDQLARFVSRQRIVVAVEEDPRDINYAPLQRNLRTLQQQAQPGEESLEIIPLPMPRPILVQGQRVPASYCNFYIANGCVLVPQFGDAADQRACQILQDAFPDRDLQPIPARDLIWGLGAFHCMTQQQPLPAPSS